MVVRLYRREGRGSHTRRSYCPKAAPTRAESSACTAASPQPRALYTDPLRPHPDKVVNTSYVEACS
jgi:hypothetical protein